MITIDKSADVDHLQFKQIESFLSNYKPHFLEEINNNENLDKMSSYVTEHLASVEHLSIVGLGGSSLSAKAQVDALDLNAKVSFFDNVDGFQFDKKINKIDLVNNHWLVISKSGQTQETMTLLDFIVQVDPRALSRLTVITTDDNNPLRQWADSNKLPLFFIPSEIGGRFSVFTAVTLIPMLFLQQKLEEIKSGVQWALEQKQLVAELSNILLTSIKNNDSLHLYWFYSDSLMSLGSWLQQLWMESLGKKNTLEGVPFAPVSGLYLARGVSDQHSLLQQVITGSKDKLVIFVSDDRSITYGDKLKLSQNIVKHNLCGFELGELLKIECKATNEALAEVGINTLGMHFKEVSAKSTSAFMTIYMMSVVAIANVLQINPFDQPGVESSKIKTREILSRLRQ